MPGNHLHIPAGSAQAGLYAAGRHLPVDVSHLWSRLPSHPFFPAVPASALDNAGRYICGIHSRRRISVRQPAVEKRPLPMGLWKSPLEHQPRHTPGLYSMLGRHRTSDGTRNEGRRKRPPTLKPKPAPDTFFPDSHQIFYGTALPKLSCANCSSAACASAVAFSRSIFFMVNRYAINRKIPAKHQALAFARHTPS